MRKVNIHFHGRDRECCKILKMQAETDIKIKDTSAQNRKRKKLCRNERKKILYVYECEYMEGMYERVAPYAFFSFLTLGNSFSLHVQRDIHDFLFIDGLNLERVFDKRVK